MTSKSRLNDSPELLSSSRRADVGGGGVKGRTYV